ncbi:NADP-dependent oxidoreductase domain-containing protein 1 [Latimeria chalumnae]|uniref:NADP-dependent oxidoreductase domain-containing protein 1 n=1 Tax=Latimeria chalumnae TaxID=7897 RepID=H3B342_LATCH|nr:PREDICTED: NADP-dependent oxidoreductase domain-containing protein 1 [Latimeria chalumnae]XP_014341471.1 PREDICTED: NADP-dependent oxidoreductase domain-containing protein 1 [Latimeria chalumnae]|eukprot:XP_005986683.1 PREDICTED: NADP-dependent oxidoreductase domain-containing protein 1 [Latimeria chalumnae]
MSDLTANLKSFQFEHGLSQDEKQLLNLRSRVWGLTVSACAHATFFCKVISAFRQNIQTGDGSLAPKVSKLFSSSSAPDLKVGILGCGYIGKQVAKAIMELTDLTAANINVSTRRPETLVELQSAGVECFYNNSGLATWADILFLCCLPCHLPKVCSDIRDHLPKSCIVYSVATAVPLLRLKKLLCHRAIIKPEYHFTESKKSSVWATFGKVTSVLQMPAVIDATCPYLPQGGICLNSKWYEAILYCALNVCSSLQLNCSRSLETLNDLFLIKQLKAEEQDGKQPLFTCESFVNKYFTSLLSKNLFFPQFDLVAVQTKDTPLSRFLAENFLIQDQLIQAYRVTFGQISV